MAEAGRAQADGQGRRAPGQPRPQAGGGGGGGEGTRVSVNGKKLSLDDILGFQHQPAPAKELPRPPPPSERPEGSLLYRCKAHDSLRSIALRFGMTPQELAALNGDTKFVFPGQEVVVVDNKAQQQPPAQPAAAMPAPPPCDPGRRGVHRTLGPIAASENLQAVGRSTFFTVGSSGPSPQPLGDEVFEFVNETLCHVHAKYITDGEGVVNGVLDATSDYLRFIPDESAIVKEAGGSERFSFYFECADLLSPRTQPEPPTFDKAQAGDVLNEGGAFHHKPAGGAAEGSTAPVYLELRVRLIFGQRPTPSTVASYWLAISQPRVDEVFAFIWRHCSILEVEQEYEHVPEADSPATEDVWKISPHAPQASPDFLSESHILDVDQMRRVARELPGMLRLSNWEIIYSTYDHGISLGTLYRNCRQFETPSVLVVVDSKGHKFGGFASDSWLVKDSFYGSGTCFLYSFWPSFRTHGFTGENQLFQQAKADGLVMGSSGGAFGLFIDGDLYHGSTRQCATYGNEPLTADGDFLITGVELWGFDLDM